MIVSGYVGGAKMVAKEKSAKAQKMMLAINIITNVLKISHKIFYRWIFHSEMLQ